LACEFSKQSESTLKSAYGTKCSPRRACVAHLEYKYINMAKIETFGMLQGFQKSNSQCQLTAEFAIQNNYGADF